MYHTDLVGYIFDLIALKPADKMNLTVTNTVKAVAAAADFAGIAESYKRIVENIGKAMLRAGRTDNVRLMAVTKTVPYEKVIAAV